MSEPLAYVASLAQDFRPTDLGPLVARWQFAAPQPVMIAPKPKRARRA